MNSNLNQLDYSGISEINSTAASLVQSDLPDNITGE